MPFTQLVRSAADAVLSITIAPECVGCGALLEQPSRGAVCSTCWSNVHRIRPPYCDRCGEPLMSWRVPAGALCARCRRAPRALDRARAAGLYEGALRSIVHAFKYGGHRSLARPLATLMSAHAPEVFEGAVAIVPVPLHRSRRRERGFNQAADLARHLAIPSVHALRRTRATLAQAGLPAGRRRGNVRNAFAVTTAGRRLRGQVVVLIDDVVTTGATLEACAGVLKAEGVAEVRAATVARAASARS